MTKLAPGLVPVEVNAELLEAKGEIPSVLAAVRGMPDTATDDLNEIFVAAAAHADKLDAARTKITKPLLESKRAVDELFMPSIKGYREIEGECRTKIERGALARIEAEEAARAKSRDALRAGDTVAANAALALPEAAPATNLSVTFEWRAEIVSLPDVPSEWLRQELDAGKIASYLAQYKGAPAVPPIPGLRFVRGTSSRKK